MSYLRYGIFSGLLLLLYGQELTKIGLILGLTGAHAYFGDLLKRGALIAVEELKDPKITLLFEDSQSTSQGGVNAYKSLILKNVPAVVTLSSHISAPIGSLANRDKVLQVACLSWAKSFSSPDDYTFRLDITTADSAEAICNYLSRINASNWAWLSVKSVWGKDSKNDVFSRCRGYFSYVEEYLEQERDLNQIIVKFKNSVNGVLIIDHRPVTVGEWIKRLRASGFTGEIIFGGAMQDDTLFRIAGDSVDGMKFIYVSLDESKIQSLYEKKFGERAINPHLVALGYEAVKILYDAFKRCNFVGIECARDVLYRTSYDTVFGKIHFDKNGDAVGLKAEIRVVENGTFKKLD